MRPTNDLFTVLTFAAVMTLTYAGLISSQKGETPSGFGHQTFNTGNLQGWSDWLHKRSSRFGSDPWSSSPDFQGWSDWMSKRNNFRMGNGARFGSAAQLQKWNDWLAKRALHASLTSPFSSQGQFQGWSDWLNKRSGQFSGWSADAFQQAGQGQQFPSFGSSGLQDWRDDQNKRQAAEAQDTA